MTLTAGRSTNLATFPSRDNTWCLPWFQKSGRTVGVVAVLALAGGVVLSAWMPRVDDRALLLLIGGVLAMGLISAALWSMASSSRGSTPSGAFRCGRSLKHWTYRRHEWRCFAEEEWGRRGQRKGWTRVLIPGALGACVGLLLAGVLTYARDWPNGTAAGILAGGMGGGLLGAAVGLLAQRNALWQWRRAWRIPGEAFVGPEGVYFNGVFHAWREIASEPGANRFVPGNPAFLELSIQSKDGPRTWRIPVPTGQERVAKGLLTIACFCSRRNRNENSGQPT